MKPGELGKIVLLSQSQAFRLGYSVLGKNDDVELFPETPSLKVLSKDSKDLKVSGTTFVC